MKIAVIAANGRLGKVFVEEALAVGHTVRAGAHHKGNLISHPNLELIQCDATNPQDLGELIAGQDVVVSTLGHVKKSKANVQTAATRVIIKVMDELGVKRFVDVTGSGVRYVGDKITVIDRLLNLAVSIIDPTRVKDGQNHIALLEKSDLAWTAIRVLKLQNVSAKPFTLKLHGPTKVYVGRREVAQAILEVITKNTFIKQAPIISNSDE